MLSTREEHENLPMPWRVSSALAHGVSSHTDNRCPSADLFSDMLFTFLCFLLVILLRNPKPIVEVLTHVTKCNRAEGPQR